jgi:hypothetical protein
MKKIIIILLFIATLCFEVNAKESVLTYPQIVKKWAKQLLKEYRLPNKKDIKGYWLECERDKKIAPYWTSGDYNGDGLIDYAFFLLRKDNKGSNVFVLISNKNRYEVRTLRSESKLSFIKYGFYEGIESVPPGKYETAHGKKYFESDDPDTISLNNSSINWYKCESANAFYYWDETNKAFKEVWMSD